MIKKQDFFRCENTLYDTTMIGIYHDTFAQIHRM